MKTYLQRISIAAALAFALLAFPAKSFGQRGESTFGVQAGYTSTNSSAVAGLFYQYNLSDRLRIAPQAGCVFRHQGLDAFQADINLHFPLKFTPGRAQLYPIVGLDFSSWSCHKDNVDGPIDYYSQPSWSSFSGIEDNDATDRVSRLGGNVGLGFQLKATPSLKLKVEGIYTVMKQYSTFAATIGIGYVF